MKKLEPLSDKDTAIILCYCNETERSVVSIAKRLHISPQATLKKCLQLIDLGFLIDNRKDIRNRKNARSLITDYKLVSKAVIEYAQLQFPVNKLTTLELLCSSFLDEQNVEKVSEEKPITGIESIAEHIYYKYIRMLAYEKNYVPLFLPKLKTVNLEDKESRIEYHSKTYDEMISLLANLLEDKFFSKHLNETTQETLEKLVALNSNACKAIMELTSQVYAITQIHAKTGLKLDNDEVDHLFEKETENKLEEKFTKRTKDIKGGADNHD